MSFNAVDRANMEISFPSKLTDYTAVGLPLLIYGPHYCSAVQWARENPGVAEVVTADNAETLERPHYDPGCGGTRCVRPRWVIATCAAARSVTVRSQLEPRNRAPAFAPASC
jgi:hypothetical protein